MFLGLYSSLNALAPAGRGAPPLEPWSDSPTVTSDSSPTVRQVRQSDSPTGPTECLTAVRQRPTATRSGGMLAHCQTLSDEGPTGPTGLTVRQSQVHSPKGCCTTAAANTYT